MLMAITTTMVKQSFKKPEHAEGTWDEEAGEQYNKMMLSLGSRWLTILATCPAPDRDIFMPRLREYVRKLYAKGKHADEFNAGFGVLYKLLHIGVEGREISVIKSACNLLMSILGRKEKLIKLPASDPNRRQKYFEVRFRDSYMIPYLRWVITVHPCTDEEVMKTAGALLAKTSFDHAPSLETFRALAHGTLDIGAVRVVKARLSSEFTFSGKGSQRQRELQDMAKVLKHIAGEGSEPPTGDLCCASLYKYADEVEMKVFLALLPSGPPPAPSTNMYDAIKKRKRKRNQ